ncbi:MAG TPA: alpha/beta hydrolase [Candidatus Saccharimonas sp.]|nr:alpha/beta hydrolase [Candidatus Saccharimonas sp.]
MKSEKHTIKLGDYTLPYWVYYADQPQTIVMFHGFRGTHHGLERIVEQLPEYQFIVPDMPGFGEAKRMQEPHTVANYAELMAKFLQALPQQNVILLGHSMGASVLAAMLASNPALTTRAIMINPVSEPPTKGLGAIKIAPGILYHHVAGKILPEKLGNRILMNKFLFLVGSATMTKTKDRELRKWIHWNHMTYMQQFSDRTSLLEAYDSSSNVVVGNFAKDISTPILMVSGNRDTITSIKAARRLAKTMPTARLVEIDNVGHIVHYEKPAEAAQAIREFIAED